MKGGTSITILNENELFQEQREVFDQILGIWKSNKHRKLICLRSPAGYGKTTIAKQFQAQFPKLVRYFDYSSVLSELSEDQYRNNETIKKYFKELSKDIPSTIYKEYLIILDHINKLFFWTPTDSKIRLNFLKNNKFLNSEGTLLIIYDLLSDIDYNFNCISEFKLEPPSVNSLTVFIKKYYSLYIDKIKDISEIKSFEDLISYITYLENE